MLFMMKKGAPVGLFFLLLITVSISSAQPEPEPKADEDIYEAVFRYQIQTWDLNADSYCLEVMGKDASKDLLERLKPLPVKAASGCRTRKRFYRKYVVDKKSGKISVIFDLSRITWLTPTEVKVEGGHYCGDQCMAGGTYRVALEGAHWIVKDFDVRVMSRSGIGSPAISPATGRAKLRSRRQRLSSLAASVESGLTLW